MTRFNRLLSLVFVGVTAACGNAGADTAVTLTRDASIGAQYGAPGPRSCSDTKQPSSGAPSSAVARAYVICGTEGVQGSTLILQSQVQVQVGKGRPYIHVRDSLEAIDPAQPVYDVRGTSVRWACSALGGVLPPSQLCTRTDTPKNEGKCYRTTFGDWRCVWADFTAPMSTDTRLNRAPPSQSEAD